MQYITGKFIEECPNRFLALVSVEGQTVECYVPSSSRLSNYLNLVGKEVILTENKNKKSRTKYTLFAVKYYRKYILLNLNNINKVVGNHYLQLNDISYEKNIEGYKSDIYLKNRNTIIEIKGLIGINRKIGFPSVYSERAITQLDKIKLLLKSGYGVEYYLVSLSPIIKKIEFNQEHSEYVSKFLECISLGMIVKAFSVQLENLNNVTFKNISLKIEI